MGSRHCPDIRLWERSASERDITTVCDDIIRLTLRMLRVEYISGKGDRASHIAPRTPYSPRPQRCAPLSGGADLGGSGRGAGPKLGFALWGAPRRESRMAAVGEKERRGVQAVAGRGTVSTRVEAGDGGERV